MGRGKRQRGLAQIPLSAEQAPRLTPYEIKGLTLPQTLQALPDLYREIKRGDFRSVAEFLRAVAPRTLRQPELEPMFRQLTEAVLKDDRGGELVDAAARLYLGDLGLLATTTPAITSLTATATRLVFATCAPLPASAPSAVSSSVRVGPSSCLAVSSRPPATAAGPRPRSPARSVLAFSTVTRVSFPRAARSPSSRS